MILRSSCIRMNDWQLQIDATETPHRAHSKRMAGRFFAFHKKTGFRTLDVCEIHSGYRQEKNK